MNVKSISRMLIIGLILAVAMPAMADVHGVLRVVKGDVQIKSAQTGQLTKARLGQEVYPKDTIVTGKDARAKIVMIDNNEINVSPDSNVEIQNYEYYPAENKKDVLLNVLYGKVRSKVEQKYDGKTSKFQVKTPSAVAGVRGTDFVTSYDPGTKSSQTVTFRGTVEFGLPGPNGTISNAVAVTPGKMAQSTGGNAPSQPTNVPKAQLAKMDNDSKAEVSSKDSRQPAQDKKGHDGDRHSPNGGSNSGSTNNSSAGAAPQQPSGGNAAPAPSAPTPAAGDSATNNSPSNSPSAAGSTTADSNGNSSGAGSSSGGDSSRTPASTSGSGSGSMPPPAAAPAGGGSPAAGSSSGGMLQTGDLAGSSGAANIADVPKTVGANMPSMVPLTGTTPNINPLTNCPTCTQIIQGGTSKLVITIK